LFVSLTTLLLLYCCREFWTLLNFIDPEKFDDQDDFLEKFGDIKSKDRIDELHDTIRPYILRRLKEDVEKSVPPKEETLVEVELTILQKQYYRALYEKNVKFLHKNKKKALDGPSLNNLAMQLRKCCNHLFLLNGVEEEIRQQQPKGSIMAEVDFLSKGSGKFVLLDKLLPRLKESGHRILLFSQFKIMLDILEDYLNARSMKFERIDGSITGPKRQQAIDRFQDPASKDPPFVMLLSTRAGGVGINLTSADTCIIFDSDWNPQNDLQAQARCHRIGQTKSVKVYRLLSRKTYEMQMFHMSSLKMGLDQAVLKGFENGASGEGAMTKEEVERLLRHGAYDIFNEDKAGTAEAESNDFVEQDIDSILARRSRTVIHDNTGSQSDAAGGTFSKASFSAKTPTGKKGSVTEDIDIEDPEFWTKMVGEAKEEERSELKPRKRSTLNYSEKFHDHRFNEEILDVSDSDASGGSDESDESDDEDFGDVVERSRWGGQRPENWKRSQARDLLDCIEQRGYGGLPWDQFLQKLPDSCKGFSEEAVRRMSWSLVLLGLAEVSRDEASMAMKRAARSAEKKREKEEGGVLAETSPSPMSSEAKAEILDAHFKKMWTVNRRWAQQALVDAGAYATSNEPRSIKVLEEKDGKVDECTKLFYKSVWPSLKGRGWKEESNETGNTFSYDEYKFGSPSAVLNEVVRIHPELANMVIPILNTLEQSRLNESRREVEDRTKHTTLDAQAIDVETLNDFLRRYSPLQLLSDRKTNNRLTIGRRVITSCHFSSVASYIVKRAESADAPQKSGDFLEDIISVDSRAALPHPLWTLKHDAILIRAIAKHGWVDREKSCRAIIEDPEIKWGFPFELTEEIVAKPLDASELGHLQSTASRAASFLENHSELVEALKGCNRPLIIESYGLKHHTPDAENADELQWKVADDLLRQASANNHGDSNVREPLDLPVKKDMAKRAKIVMRNTITSIKSGVQPGTAKSTVANPNVNQPTNDYGYAVIDQGDRCCILLAEMVRGIVKGSSTKMAKQMRFMFAIAHEEASALEKMFSSEESAKPKAEEMKKIAGYIATAKKSMKSAAIPSKNILRVMLGLEPLSLRSGNSTSASLFPTADTFENAASKPQSKKESHRREDGALGEKAIARSMKKAFDKSALEKSDGSPCLFFKYTDPDLGLQLTMIEIMILFTCCSEGIPLSSSHMSISSDSMESKLPWESIASILEITVKDALLTSTEKIVKCRAALTN
jgi:superfamily II DNA/RNA helicase